jgi:hypothetical protein
MSRAARAPDGRRGGPGGRRGPRPASDGARDGARAAGAPRGPRGPGRGGPSGPPRVITVESSKPIEHNRGHKGELRSLAGLRGLLPPASEPEPAAEQRTGDSAPPPP